jgi:hypothetical protein
MGISRTRKASLGKRSACACGVRPSWAGKTRRLNRGAYCCRVLPGCTIGADEPCRQNAVFSLYTIGARRASDIEFVFSGRTSRTRAAVGARVSLVANTCEVVCACIWRICVGRTVSARGTTVEVFIGSGKARRAVPSVRTGEAYVADATSQCTACEACRTRVRWAREASRQSRCSHCSGVFCGVTIDAYKHPGIAVFSSIACGTRAAVRAREPVVALASSQG